MPKPKPYRVSDDFPVVGVIVGVVCLLLFLLGLGLAPVPFWRMVGGLG